jgi:HK97 family phage major capsid protein
MNIQQKLKECRESLAEKSASFKAKMDGDLTPEVRTELDTLSEEITALKGDLLRYETALKMEQDDAKRNLPVNIAVSTREKDEIKRFNLSKFLREASDKGGLTGFELEMHQEANNETRDALAGTASSQATPNGFGIPQDVMDMMRHNIAVSRSQKGMNLRAQSTTNTEGGYGIQTDVNAFIEPLYPNPVVARLGATVLDNLVGNQRWPKDTNLFSFAFESEIGASDDTSKTWGTVELSPKRMAGRADISRRLLLQEKSRGMQSYLEQEFVRGVDVAVDIAALNGSGAANNPTGILNTSGIANIIMSANGAVPTWSQMLQFAKELDQDSALNGNLSYLTTPEMKAILMATLKNATYGTTGYIWETNNTVGGYNAYASTSVPKGLTIGSSSLAHAIIFGNWSDLLVGKWGGTYVLVDPYTQATTSQVRIHCELQMDIAVRRTQSFAISKSALNGLSS